jgi:XTP/dITP diphosphohydrolase
MAFKICFATNNSHKISEIKHLFGGLLEIQSLKEIGCFEELPETGTTIEQNSLQKAQYVFEKYQVPCFADDSGLEVEVLDGEPGVNSAHYSGTRDDKANMELLLDKMKDFTNRKARFKTVITFVNSSVNEAFEGLVEGELLPQPRGSNGFGYDPIFIPNGYEKTFAEMTLDEKSEISHRKIAATKLFQFLNSSLAEY